MMASATVLQRLQHRASQADLILNQLREQLRYLKSKADTYVYRFYLLNDHEIISQILEFILFKWIIAKGVRFRKKTVQ